MIDYHLHGQTGQGKWQAKFRRAKLHPEIVSTISTNGTIYRKMAPGKSLNLLLRISIFFTFTCSEALGNFLPERHEKVVFHFLSDKIFRKRLVNGKQSVKLYTPFKTQGPESHTLFSGAVVRTCPFRKPSLSFLRHLENFLPVTESISIN